MILHQTGAIAVCLRRLWKLKRTGWRPAHGTVLDIGCGLGEVAAWFSERTYATVAIDIAESAVRKGRTMHVHLPSPPEYLALAIAPDDRLTGNTTFLSIVAALHQIPREEIPNYVRNISYVAAPDARMLLFVKAFRDGQSSRRPRRKAVPSSVGQQGLCWVFYH